MLQCLLNITPPIIGATYLLLSHQMTQFIINIVYLHINYYYCIACCILLLIISIALHAAIYSYYHFHKQYVLPLHCMLQFIIIISLTITYYHCIACCNLSIMYYHWIVGCNLLFIMSCSYPISHPFHWDNC